MAENEDSTDMGNIQWCACEQKERKKSVDDYAAAASEYAKVNQNDAPKETNELQYQFEQNIIDNTIMKSGKVTKAAIVGLEHGALRAWSPPDFIPKQQCITDLINAFEGDIDGLAEHGIDVGCDVNVSVPGKMDPGRAIYGNDGQRGGTSVFKSKNCLLIVVFSSNPTLANRLALETVEYMEEQGR